MMNWITLETEDQLAEVLKKSNEKTQAIFKHSTRCHISKFVKSNLENEWNISSELLDVYYLDLIAYRSVSNAIENLLKVRHESPQIILIRNGKAIYNESHQSIDASDLKEHLAI
jgi:bacillithiol system protein YtxJ